MFPNPTFWSTKKYFSFSFTPSQGRPRDVLAGNGNHQAVDLVLLLQFGLVQVIIIRFALTCSALQSFSYIMNGHIAIHASLR